MCECSGLRFFALANLQDNDGLFQFARQEGQVFKRSDIIEAFHMQTQCGDPFIPQGRHGKISEAELRLVAGGQHHGDWQAALEEYLQFTLPTRRALATIVKQLARLQLLREAQRDKEQSLLAFELLAHSAQALAAMERSA